MLIIFTSMTENMNTHVLKKSVKHFILLS